MMIKECVRSLLVIGVVIVLLQPSDGWLFPRRRRRRCSKRDCSVSNWGSWGPCSHSCGSFGVKSRNRNKVRSESCGGTCPYSLRSVASCNRVCCPIPCRWMWGQWGACNGCGTNGVQTRKVMISQQSYCKGAACPGITTESRRCDTQRCCPVDCTTSSWSKWSPCNAQCETTGMHNRSRGIQQIPSCGGAACGPLGQRGTCSGDCCPRDCVVTSWTKWSKCISKSGSCDVNGGQQTKTRVILASETCNGTCGQLQETRDCTVGQRKCQLSHWSPWSPCYASNGFCGNGTMNRTRNVITHPICDVPCNNTIEQGSCEHSCCPVNCTMTDWSQWSNCSNDCGEGTSTRTRTIIVRAFCGGTTCGPEIEDTKCTQHRNVNCSMTSWSNWSQCSVGCGIGNQTRNRSIGENFYCNGVRCGQTSDARECRSYRENQDCKVGPWSSWSSCLPRCAIGTTSRRRSVAVPQRCLGSRCPTLHENLGCGSVNGGCSHFCQNDTCSCPNGFYLHNSSVCQRIDCGLTAVFYCPPGEDQTACLTPMINCSNASTRFESICPLTCQSTHSLKGSATTICMASGVWSTAVDLAYCRRINDAPTDIILTGSSSVLENEPSSALIGLLQSVDVNQHDNHTYTLESGGQGYFEVVGDELRSIKSFNYETDPQIFYLTVQSTDDGHLPMSTFKVFSITVEDVNERPTDVMISENYLDENSEFGTVVGQLWCIDEDAKDTFTYNIDAHDRFNVVGNTLQVSSENGECLWINSTLCPLNYEIRSSYTLRITCKDDGYPPYEIVKNVSINLRDMNDPPYNIRMSSNQVKENVAIGTEIGYVTVDDEDSRTTLSYFTADVNDALRVLSNGSIVTINETNHEESPLIKLSVRIMDTGRNPTQTVTGNLTVFVTDVNEPIEAITITSTGGQTEFLDDQPQMEENKIAGAVVGQIVIGDVDDVNYVNVSLLHGDDGHFTLNSSIALCHTTSQGRIKSICNVSLLTAAALDYEVKSRYDVILLVEDGEHVTAKQFSIQVLDVNDEPTEVEVIGLRLVNENEPGATIGQIRTIDQDFNQSYIYELLNHTDVLEIDGSMLRIKKGIYFDYETNQVWSVAIRSTDNGTPSFSTIGNIEITVLDRNDVPLNIILSSSRVFENSQAGVIVANITVTDEDDNSTEAATWSRHTCSVVNSSLPAFEVVFNNQLIVKERLYLDYEAEKQIQITLSCSDMGGLRRVQVFNVDIGDVNEKPTDIKLTTSAVEENSKIGKVIGTLSTSDPDNHRAYRQNFTYTMQNTSQAESIALKGCNLVVAGPLDFEAGALISVVIVTQDDGDPPMKFTRRLSISLIDVNDKSLDITINNDKVQENSDQGHLVGQLSTLDQDSGQKYIYAILNDTSVAFTVRENRLEVGISNSNCLHFGGQHCLLNYENQSIHSVTISSTDDGTPPLTIQKTFQIYVEDTNDRPRNIQLSNYRVYEGTAKGFEIGSLSVIDEDADQRHSFELQSNGNSSFYIDASRNVLKLGKLASDYEKRRIHTVSISATDDGSPTLKITEEITIEILDVNEPPVSLNIRSASGEFDDDDDPIIDENLPIGTIFAHVIAFDHDANATTMITLDRNPNHMFALSSNVSCQVVNMTNGVMTSKCSQDILVNGTLDYETKTSYNLIFRVVDDKGLYTMFRRDIHIRDINEPPTNVYINRGTTAYVSEESKGAFVGVIATVDQDIQQSYVYHLEGDGANQFKFTQHILFVADGTSLDYETQQSYSLVLTAEDTSPKAAFNISKNITIYVNNINEAPVEINLIGDVSLTENQPPYTFMANISVIDPDNSNGDVQFYTHTCMLRTNTKLFMIIDNKLYNKVSLDYERDGMSQMLSIECKDNGIPSLSKRKEFSVTICDVNEAPVSVSISSNSVRENSPNGTLIGSLSCADPEQRSCTYKILHADNVSTPFRVIGDLIYTLDSLDYEANSKWLIRVLAKDSGTKPAFLTAELEIEIADVNEAPVNITLSSNLVLENSPSGTLIGQLTTEDPDRGQQHTYALIDDSDGSFALKSNKLFVAADADYCQRYGGQHCKLNYERHAITMVTIRSYDDGIPRQHIDRLIRIAIADANDSPRDIRLSQRRVFRNASVGHRVGKVLFNDEDSTSDSRITLTEDGGGHFDVDKEGYVIVARELSTDGNQIAKTVTVIVKDNGKPNFKVEKQLDILIEEEPSPDTTNVLEIVLRPFGPLSAAENSPVGLKVGQIEAVHAGTINNLTLVLGELTDKILEIGATVCENHIELHQELCIADLVLKQSLNFELQDYIDVDVIAHYGQNHTMSSIFRLGVTDENDAPVKILAGGSTDVYVAENTKNALIATLNTIDEDFNQSYTYRLLDDAGSRFAIVQGRLFVSGDLDYETTRTHLIQIKVTDSGSPTKSINQTITVHVSNINEAPTELTLAGSRAIENISLEMEQMIGEIVVNDPDNQGPLPPEHLQTVRCQVLNPGGRFRIVNKTHLMINCTEMNCDKSTAYVVVIRCTDDGVPPKVIESTVLVTTNQSTKAASYEFELSSISVEENGSNVTVGVVMVTNSRYPSPAVALEFVAKVTRQDIEGLFEMRQMDLVATEPLDYEARSEYNISISVTESNGLFIERSFVIQVIDVDDAPTGISLTHAVNGFMQLPEDTAVGTVVSIAHVQDEDRNDMYSYTISSIASCGASGTPPFVIGKFTGALTLTIILTSHTCRQFIIKVRGTSLRSPSMVITELVIFNVTAINVAPSSLTISNDNIAENSPIGRRIGVVIIEDFNNRHQPQQTHSCRLVDSMEAPFRIINKTSLVVAKSNLNYEQRGSYTVEIFCQEDAIFAPHNITSHFTIFVRNVNEKPRQFTISNDVIKENNLLDEVICEVSWYDPDNEVAEVDQVKITIAPVDDSSYFELMNNKRLTAKKHFDYERRSEYHVQFIAQDSGSPTNVVMFNKTIKIRDVNEAPYNITLSRLSVQENTPRGYIVANLTTSDDDMNQTHTYTLYDSSNSFKISNSTIIVDGRLDYETTPSISITINSEDHGAHSSLSFQASFTIQIEDTNDLPSITSIKYLTVPETNRSKDVPAATFSVLDQDISQSSYCTQLAGIHNVTLTVMNTTSFQVSIGPEEELDFETSPFVNVVVRCTDNGLPPLFIDRELNIKISDVNEPPAEVFVGMATVLNIPENTAPGTVAAAVTCVDPDQSQSHTYLLSDENTFKIDQVNNLVVVNSTLLDYETAKYPFTLNITAVDNGFPPLTLTVPILVRVLDVNEPPVDVRLTSSNGNTIKVNESLHLDTYIGQLTCDNPEGTKQDVKYEAIETTMAFNITTVNGSSYLTLAKELDYDKARSHSIEVVATDNGIPPLTGIALLRVIVIPTDPCSLGTSRCHGDAECHRVGSDSYSCTCNNGFDGDGFNCTEHDDCAPSSDHCETNSSIYSTPLCSPCKNNATCEDGHLRFHCTCPPGFTSVDCGTDIDDCATDPCHHGHCIDQPNDYNCDCDKGYKGKQCHVEINECDEDGRCLAGTCTDMLAGFACTCESYATGLFCNRKKEFCLSSRCGENKVCYSPPHRTKERLISAETGHVCLSRKMEANLPFTGMSLQTNGEIRNWTLHFHEFTTKFVRINISYLEDGSNTGDLQQGVASDVQYMLPLDATDDAMSAKFIIKVGEEFVRPGAYLLSAQETCRQLKRMTNYQSICTAVENEIKRGNVVSKDFVIKERKTHPKLASVVSPHELTAFIGIGAGALFLVLFLTGLVLVRRNRQCSIRIRHNVNEDNDPASRYKSAMARHNSACSENEASGQLNDFAMETNGVRSRAFENPLYNQLQA